jgi:hypothetical protein
MSQKSSIFVRQTREREGWLTASEGIDAREGEQSLAVAALTRGVIDAIPVPPEAEEDSRVRAVAEMQDLRRRQGLPTNVVAPWYLRVGSSLRHVFTITKKR